MGITGDRQVVVRPRTGQIGTCIIFDKTANNFMKFDRSPRSNTRSGLGIGR